MKSIKRICSLLLIICLVIGNINVSFAGDESSEWQIMKTGNYGAGTTAGVDTAVNNAPVTNYSKTSESDSKVIVSKEISATTTENEFDITLTVKTKQELNEDVQNPDAAIALIIDTSGSMSTKDSYRICNVCKNRVTVSGDKYHCDTCNKNYKRSETTKIESSSRIEAAKEAAITFIDSLVENAQADTHRYVCLIPFNGNVNTSYDWVDVMDEDDYDSIVNAIDRLTASGGTNFDSALRQAKVKLDEKADFANRFTVALTDGAPTYYIKPDGTRGGNGSDSNTADCDATKASANALKASHGALYTICYGASNDYCYEDSKTKKQTVSAFLSSFATNNYSAEDADDVKTSFDSISHLIALLTEAWTVTDPMGEHIQFKNIVSTDKGTCVSVENNSISWDLKSDSSFKVTGTSSNKTYTYILKYRVELMISDNGFTEDTYYPTNGYTSLSYVFYNDDYKITDEAGNVLENQDTATANIIAFSVPGVKGNIPTYAFNVEYYKKINGTYTLADSSKVKDVAMWTEITVAAFASSNYLTKYDNFKYVNAPRVLDSEKEITSDWVITEDGMTLQLFYDPIPTQVEVNYFTRTDIIDATNGDLILGTYTKDRSSYTESNNLLVGQEYTAKESNLTERGYVEVLENSENVNGSEDFTLNPITLIEETETDKNVINLYFKTVDDEREEATVNFYHIYKDYKYEIVNGELTEVCFKDTSKAEDFATVSTLTAKVPKHEFSHAYDNAEVDGGVTYTYVEDDYDFSASIYENKNNNVKVTPKTSGEYNVYLTFEHHEELPDEIVVKVNHTYKTNTEILVFDEETNTYSTKFVETDSFTEHDTIRDEYSVYPDETVEVTEAPKTGYTSADANEAKLIHENSKDNDLIELEYHKEIPLDTVNVKTISHFREWFVDEVNTTTGAITWAYNERAEIIDIKNYPTSEDEKLYVGQALTVEANPEKREGYTLDLMKDISGETSDNPEIKALEDDIVLEFFFDKCEDIDIEVASVQVIHKYYENVETINGVTKTFVTETKGDILYNLPGETETFAIEEDVEGFGHFAVDPGQTYTIEYTSLGNEEVAGSTLIINYCRYRDTRVATDLSVLHSFYSKTMFVENGVAKYPEDWTLDDSYYNPEEATAYKGDVLYEGMLVEVDPEIVEGYTEASDNRYEITLGEIGTNLVELDYYKEVPLEPVSVKVTHTYKLYTYTYEESAESKSFKTMDFGVNDVTATKFVGESYDAKAVFVGKYELESCTFNGADVTENVINGTFNISAVTDKDQVDYVYALVEGKREPAEVKVFHFYTTIDDYNDKIIAGYVKATGLDVETDEVYIPEGSDAYDTFVGLTFTATPDCKPLDGEDSYKQIGVTPNMTIEVVEGENIINIYYERHICSHVKVNATEHHTYFVYDKYTNETEEIYDLEWSHTEYGLWDGEKFSATPDTKDGYEIQTSEENLTIVLLSDSDKNIVEVKYLKTIDTTPTETHRPHRPKDEPKEEIVEEVIEEPVEEIIEEIIEDTEEVPLSDLPEELVEDPIEDFELFDEEVPLANVPATGDKSSIYLLIAFMSMMILAVIGLRKREEEK